MSSPWPITKPDLMVHVRANVPGTYGTYSGIQYLDKGKNRKTHLGTRGIVSLMFGLHSVFGKTCMHLVSDFQLCGSTFHG